MTMWRENICHASFYDTHGTSRNPERAPARAHSAPYRPRTLYELAERSPS